MVRLHPGPSTPVCSNPCRTRCSVVRGGWTQQPLCPPRSQGGRFVRDCELSISVGTRRPGQGVLRRAARSASSARRVRALAASAFFAACAAERNSAASPGALAGFRSLRRSVRPAAVPVCPFFPLICPRIPSCPHPWSRAYHSSTRDRGGCPAGPAAVSPCASSRCGRPPCASSPMRRTRSPWTASSARRVSDCGQRR